VACGDSSTADKEEIIRGSEKPDIEGFRDFTPKK
jgi:hypothetical protein